MKYRFLIFVFFYSIYCSSQDTVIEFDRPGVADLPYLVPLKTLQVEAGYTFGVNDSSNFSYDKAPGFLLRFSPVKFFELRFMINYMPMSLHFAKKYDNQNWFGLAIGAKVKICREKGLRPELAVEGMVTFPVQGFVNPDIGVVGAELYFLGNNFFTKWFYFNYNVGYIYGNKYLNHSLSYSSCFGFIMHKYVELFVEHFAFIHSHDIPDWGIDGGICFFPTPRFQVDLSYVRLFNSFSNLNTFNFGLSYNIGLHKDHYRNLFWKK